MIQIHDDQPNNPLTEIGLALSMCFFSAFMLISVMKTTTHDAEALSLNQSAKSESEQTRPIYLYRDDKFYTHDGTSVNPSDIAEQQIIVALPTGTTVDQALRIREQLSSSDIQFATLPHPAYTLK